MKKKKSSQRYNVPIVCSKERLCGGMDEGTDAAFQRGKSVMGEIRVWGGGRH